jgi:hypothetical protein
MNPATAATKIARAWTRTAMRIGRLGQGANNNRINYASMKNVPLSTLQQILLRTVAGTTIDWRYRINEKGHMYNRNTRMNRKTIIHDIAMLTNLRPNIFRERAARILQRYARTAAMRRRLALISSNRLKQLPSPLVRRILSV